MKIRLPVIALIALSCASACAPGVSTNSNSNAQANAQAGAANSSAGGPQVVADRGEAVLRLDGGTASVEYGRPALQGRDVEKMISPGQEWRMGSNDPTTLKADVDLRFGERIVPKGEYILKARADDQQKWNLLIQNEGGATVAEVPLTFQKVGSSAELLTIELKGKGKAGAFVLHWGNLMLSTDFQKA
jgi:hypothetical protein